MCSGIVVCCCLISIFWFVGWNDVFWSIGRCYWGGRRILFCEREVGYVEKRVGEWVCGIVCCFYVKRCWIYKIMYVWC